MEGSRLILPWFMIRYERGFQQHNKVKTNTKESNRIRRFQNNGITFPLESV